MTPVFVITFEISGLKFLALKKDISSETSPDWLGNKWHSPFYVLHALCSGASQRLFIRPFGSKLFWPCVVAVLQLRPGGLPLWAPNEEQYVTGHMAVVMVLVQSLSTSRGMFK